MQYTIYFNLMKTFGKLKLHIVKYIHFYEEYNLKIKTP